jgi:N-dimethylarginine dimethylaminohydrolase
VTDYNKEFIYDIEAIPGERWFPKESNFEDDMNEYWGDWGVSSEVDTLKAVLIRRPGKEVEDFDPDAVRFSDEPLDVELMRKQHDNVAQVYKDFGAKVYYVEEQREDRPNAVFCRDLMFMTPEGAILTRPGMAARRGEERYVAQALAKYGVPILKTVAGDGMFEGANAMWVDRHTCVVSTGVRCNRSGYEQVKHELERMGVEVYHMQQPYSNIHIDGLMNPISHDKVLIHASQVPYDIIDMLKKKGYEILEAPSQSEVRERFACNFVALEPNHIVIAEGPVRTIELLEKHGVKVETVDVSEITKGKGSLHCITAFLKRG